ncbi:hypothetical protein T484DRAFT_1909532, partial [Baffinella frigidus]
MSVISHFEEVISHFEEALKVYDTRIGVEGFQGPKLSRVGPKLSRATAGPLAALQDSRKAETGLLLSFPEGDAYSHASALLTANRREWEFTGGHDTSRQDRVLETGGENGNFRGKDDLKEEEARLQGLDWARCHLQAASLLWSTESARIGLGGASQGGATRGVASRGVASRGVATAQLTERRDAASFTDVGAPRVARGVARHLKQALSVFSPTNNPREWQQASAMLLEAYAAAALFVAQGVSQDGRKCGYYGGRDAGL